MSVQPGDNESKVYVYQCANERCVWFETQWIVQVQKDGSVPVRPSGTRGRDKDFHSLTAQQESLARRYLEQVVLDDAEEQAAITGKPVEIDEDKVRQDIAELGK